jgi:hypothetical protein
MLGNLNLDLFGKIIVMVYPCWVCVLKLSLLEIPVCPIIRRNMILLKGTGGGHVIGGGVVFVFTFTVF